MEPSPQEERDRRIAELEARVNRPRSLGVKAPAAAVAIAAALILGYMDRHDLAYLFAPRAPIVLGHEGEYAFDRLTSNRYAQLHGTPTTRGAFAREGGETYVVVGLRDTPVLVRRHALLGEEWDGRRMPPQPDQRPFAIGGRLLSRQDASRYADAFEKLSRMGEVRPRDGQLWIVLEGERPGEDLGTAVLGGLLIAFIVANAYFLMKDLAARRARSRA